MNYCDSCGVAIELTALAPVERSSGCRLWLCWPCQDRAYGVVDVDDARWLKAPLTPQEQAAVNRAALQLLP